MQAELQGWHVTAGHGPCKGDQGPLGLMSKIGSEEKVTDWLCLVCPVSVATMLARKCNGPGDSDLPDISAIGR